MNMSHSRLCDKFYCIISWTPCFPFQSPKNLNIDNTLAQKNYIIHSKTKIGMIHSVSLRLLINCNIIPTNTTNIFIFLFNSLGFQTEISFSNKASILLNSYWLNETNIRSYFRNNYLKQQTWFKQNNVVPELKPLGFRNSSASILFPP